MARQKAEIAPWKWVEKTKPEDVSQEHILVAYRLQGQGIVRCPYRCSRNCRKNPYCIWGLGEKAWILNSGEDNSDEDNNPEFRKEDDFAGIINLGTTCYVNALLQLWFHNPIIRPAILGWKPSYATNCDSKYEPKCPLGQLQAMFARMKLSKRSAIDPTTLIESLNLNVAEQQDAQEFAKLFMSMLSQLATEDALQGELNRAFEGTSVYEMECKECRNQHSREETFTELDLCVKDVKDTSASFAKLFTEEELTGDNQYLCQYCSKKTDAIRRFGIVKLPPVLNIQLLRFIYDKDTRRKKKVTTPYAFPEFLDMSPYVKSEGSSAEDFKYQLTGYLVHNGKSASSGHYIAHIRDIRTGAWHIFNDDSVSEQKSSKSAKNNSEEGTTLKIEKTGEYKSTGAYMLVYTHQSLMKNPTPDPEVPPYLKQLVADEDATFECEFQTSKKEREVKAQYLEERKSTVDALYSLLVPEREPGPVEIKENHQNGEVPQINGIPAKGSETKNPQPQNKRGRPKESEAENGKRGKEKNVKDSKQTEQQLAYEKAKEYQDRYSVSSMVFLPYTWLTAWLNQTTETVPKIDTKEILCPHNKLILPLGTTSVPFKAIPTEVADVLYEKYGGEQRLNGKSALCKECVECECRHQRALMDLDNDHKQVQDLMVKTQKAIETYQKNREGVDYSEDFWKDKVWVSKNSLRKWKGWARARIFLENPEKDEEMVENSQESAPQNFNDDIKCQHDRLSVDEGTRRLASVETWSIIQKYFPDCFEALASSVSPCTECQEEKDRSKNQAAENRKVAEKLKERIPDLLRNKNRPRGYESGHYYFVDPEFVRSIVGFTRNPERYDERPIAGDVENLLCEHKKFKYPIELVERLKNDLQEFVSSPEADRVHVWYLVREDEWSSLIEYFSFEQEVHVFIEHENCLYFPEICEPCSQEWYQDTHMELCSFINEPLYMKLMDSDDVEMVDQNHPADDDADEDFQVMQPQSKKKKTANKEPSAAEVRRSGRSRHGKKEKKVIASSTDTVKQLKFSLVRELNYKILASDITLYFKDKPLLNESETLSSIGIYPNTVLDYRTEIRDENDDSMEVDSNREPETGFAGTMLQLRLDERRHLTAARPMSSTESQESS